MSYNVYGHNEDFKMVCLTNAVYIYLHILINHTEKFQ